MIKEIADYYGVELVEVQAGDKYCKANGEDFFNYQKVLEDNSFSLIELQKEIGDCIVFGELFGGICIKGQSTC